MLSAELGTEWPLFVWVVNGPLGFKRVEHSAKEHGIEVLWTGPLHLKVGYVHVCGVPYVSEVEFSGVVAPTVYPDDFWFGDFVISVLGIVELLVVELAIFRVGGIQLNVISLEKAYRSWRRYPRRSRRPIVSAGV